MLALSPAAKRLFRQALWPLALGTSLSSILLVLPRLLPGHAATAKTSHALRQALPFEQSLADVLEPEKPVTKEIAGGQTHSYSITLPANQYLHLAIEQHGIDVSLALHAPGGNALIETNSPTGSQGAEALYFISESGGSYRIKVRPAHATAQPGSYTLTVLATRPSQPQDQSRIAAQRAYLAGEQLRTSDLAQSLRHLRQAVAEFSSLKDQTGTAVALVGQGRTHNFLGQSALALECFEHALALFRATADRNGESLALYRAAEVISYAEPSRALEQYQQSLKLARAAGNQILEAYALSDLGDIHRVLGELAAAQGDYEQARKLQRITGNERAGAATLVQMGTLFYLQSRLQASLEAYQQAAQFFRAQQARREEANALIGVGNIWLLIGEYEKAIEQFEQSLAAAQAGGYRHVEAIVQTNLGVAHLRLGQYPSARRVLQNAYRLGEAVESGGIRAEALQSLGEVCAAEGDREQAMAYYDQAIKLIREQGSPNAEAEVLFSIGRLQYQSGQPMAALTNFQTAREKWQLLGDRLGMARALSALSRVHSALNQPADALRCNQEALTLIEALRSDLISYESRASLSATFQTAYEQQIALLMRQHQQNPNAGYEQQALQVSERARSLLELLSEARAEIRAGVDANLLASERDTQRALNAKAEEQLRLPGGAHTPEQAVTLKREIAALTAQHQEIAARIRAASPGYAALTQPQPLTLAEIQQQVLDDDTLLLEYALGDERSFLWLVGKHSVTSYELPKRAEIEAAARHVYDLLTARQPHPELTTFQHQKRIADAEKSYWPRAAAFSQMVLGPVAPHLGNKRLLIVAPGALQYVPFAALPTPQAASGSTVRNPQAPLMLDHEIINSPSASVLAVLRHEFSGRQPAAKAIAVLADPVFSSDDSRVKIASADRRTVTSTPALAMSALSRVVKSLSSGLPRLPGSRDQAKEILAMVPPETSLLALDFNASLELAISPELRQYRILHFATHGLLDDRHPELSGLALSLVNEAGHSQDRFLRLHEIYNLRLNADLVVLSACQTGLGKEINGEGLVGLTRGFMYAGAPRVVASLWQVEDVATAELMKRFYRGMMRDGLTAAAALRAAQIEMWKKKQWQSPYFWSAFTLQGEWR